MDIVKKLLDRISSRAVTNKMRLFEKMMPEPTKNKHCSTRIFYKKLKIWASTESFLKSSDFEYSEKRVKRKLWQGLRLFHFI